MNTDHRSSTVADIQAGDRVRSFDSTGSPVMIGTTVRVQRGSFDMVALASTTPFGPVHVLRSDYPATREPSGCWTVTL